jgi:ribosomal-protein-alanine N-acetyltransferase
MDTRNVAYQIRPMTEGDLNEVMAIEKMAFTLPWSVRAFRYELLENESSRLLVVRAPPAPARPGPLGRLGERVRQALGPSGAQEGPLVGYACLWALVDEAHISTIAVHPAWRRRGIGSLLISALLEEAQTQHLGVVTLEVRVSNTAAQALYYAWGFRVVGRRRRYYSDTGEDALIMTTPPLERPDFQAAVAAKRATLRSRLRSGPPVLG